MTASSSRGKKAPEQKDLVGEVKLIPSLNSGFGTDSLCVISSEIIAQSYYDCERKISHIYFININNQTIEKTLEDKDQVSCIAYDGTDLITGYRNHGVLKFWDITTGVVKKELIDIQSNGIVKVIASGSQQLIILDSAHKVKLLKAKQKGIELFALSRAEDRPKFGDIVVRGNHVIGFIQIREGVSSDRAGKVHVFDLNTRDLITFKVPGDARWMDASENIIAVSGISESRYHVVFYDFRGKKTNELVDRNEYEGRWFKICALLEDKFFCIKGYHFDKKIYFLIDLASSDPILQTGKLNVEFSKLYFNRLTGNVFGQVNTMGDPYPICEIDLGYQKKLLAELKTSAFGEKTFEYAPGVVIQYLGFLKKPATSDSDAPEEDKERGLTPPKKKDV